MTEREQRELLTLAKELAVGAGSVLKRGFQSRKKIDYKGRINPVTDYDYKAEQYIISRIKKRFPDHEFLAEEGTATGSQSSYRWVIDPLDGTVNYAHEFPMYCVSIALEHEGEVELGAVYDPEREELFHAARGHGARMNREKLAVSDTDKLQRALLATGFAYDIGTSKKNNLGLFARMAKRAEGIRRPGSAALDLCWLAAGRIDGFWELKLHPWDTAAAKLIVQEAGGKVTRIDGSPYSIFDDDILASNVVLHKQMQRVLSSQQ